MLQCISCWPPTSLGIFCRSILLLLLLLSRFSRVQLCATPETEAHQAPPSLGFSRQEHWSGLHLLLQCMKVKSNREVAQSCLDCSLPGSSIPGIFQARVLEWGAIAFSSRSILVHAILVPWNGLVRKWGGVNALGMLVSAWEESHAWHVPGTVCLLLEKAWPVILASWRTKV